MTAIDRTIYRRMKRSYATKELIEAFTPTEEECRFYGFCMCLGAGSRLFCLGKNGVNYYKKVSEIILQRTTSLKC